MPARVFIAMMLFFLDSTGIIIGSVIGSLILFSLLCVSILFCAVVIAILCHKKRSSRVRIINVVQRHSEDNYQLSDFSSGQLYAEPTTTIQKNSAGVQEDSNHELHQNEENDNSALESKSRDSMDDFSMTNDTKPLIH